LLYIKGTFRKLKITGFIPDLLIAGGHLTTIRLLEELEERGHDVLLLTMSNRHKIKTSLEVKIIKDPKQSSAICRKRDIVITSGGKHRVHFLNSPFVAYLHSLSALKEMNEVIFGATILVVNSHWMQKEIDRSSIVIYPKIITYDGPLERECITMVNLNQFKDPKIFYKLARLLPTHKFLGVKGGWGEQVIPKNITDNVEIIESTDDMGNDVYRRTKILLMPSESESFGMVGLEAMSCGIPVISAMSYGGMEILGDINGCMESRAELWAEEIVRLNNKQYYKERSDAVYQQYLRLTEGNNVDKLEEEIYKLLKIYHMPECSISEKWWENIICIQKNPLLCLMMAGEKRKGYVADTAVVTGPVYLGLNSKIDHYAIIEGPVYIGDNTIIGSHTKVRAGSYIGNNCLVGSFSDVKSSIVHNNVNIGPASAIHDSYIERDAFLGGVRAASLKISNKPMRVKDGNKLIEVDTNKLGTYFGEGCSVATGMIYSPGRRVEAWETVKLKNLAE